MILRAYDERSSLRGLTRTFGVARNTVTTWLKKIAEAAATGSHAGRPRPGKT
jgi:transposase-like protein